MVLDAKIDEVMTEKKESKVFSHFSGFLKYFFRPAFTFLALAPAILGQSSIFWWPFNSRDPELFRTVLRSCKRPINSGDIGCQRETHFFWDTRYIKRGCPSVPLWPQKVLFLLNFAHYFMFSQWLMIFLLCKKKVKHDPTKVWRRASRALKS